MSDQEKSPSPKYNRVVLKLSGESLSRAGERGINMEEVAGISRQISQAQQLGCEIAIVCGGGNILREVLSSKKKMLVFRKPRPTIWECWQR